MIFRRIKSHLEKENWFAVFVDFLIVVSGVFIGVQLGNWNEARADRQDVVKALERLGNEVESNMGNTKSGISRLDEGLDARLAALSLLEDCDAPDISNDMISDALGVMTGDIVPSFVDNMTREIGRKDRFTDLLSDEFRAALNLYDAQLSDEIDQLKVNFGLMWDQHVIYHPYVGMNITDDNLIGAAYTLSAPVREVCNDPVFRRKFIMTNVWHTSTKLRLERFNGYNEVFLEAISTELGNLQ